MSEYEFNLFRRRGWHDLRSYLRQRDPWTNRPYWMTPHALRWAAGNAWHNTRAKGYRAGEIAAPAPEGE